MSAPASATLTWIAAGAALVLSPALAMAEDLALRRVMLSAGGVGYFEYEAEVSGNATLELSVRLDQVDDVIKSIVVYDDHGVAGAIRLAGRNPVEQIFKDLPFGPRALSSPIALLNALPGVGVRATGQRQVEGRLVGVVPETQVVPDGGGTVTRHRVTAMTPTGIQSFLLEEADAVSFTDPALSSQVDGALAAVSAHRTRDRRTLFVTSNGVGERTVRVGYVVSAPLWKATYRLSVSDGAPARLQGWAVLENMSGQDWKDVELTLVSGNPVTFRQALYAAYYADRPEVPVEVLGRVLPVPDTGAVGTEAPGRSEEAEHARAEQPVARPGRAVVGRAAEKSGLRGMPASSMALDSMNFDQAEPSPAPVPEQARILAAASTEAATSVSFRIPHAVNVSSGQSLLVPVIDRDVPAERVSLYQPATHARHPLAAVRLRNDGETGLPPGVLTLYETGERGSAFIGDAQLSPLPAGGDRLVSYALDQKTLVDREDERTQAITTGRIVDGVLELTYAQQQRTVYRLKAPAKESRNLLIEHPRHAGWRLEEPEQETIAVTDSHYRIEQRLAPGETRALAVVLARPQMQKLALTGLSTPMLAAYAANGELDRDLRKAFAGMAELGRAVDAQRLRLEDVERRRNEIHGEQGRLRDNLSRVPRGTDLHTRYLDKLDAQEDRLESLQGESSRLRAALDKARADLADYIRRLEI